MENNKTNEQQSLPDLIAEELKRIKVIYRPSANRSELAVKLKESLALLSSTAQYTGV